MYDQGNGQATASLFKYLWGKDHLNDYILLIKSESVRNLFGTVKYLEADRNHHRWDIKLQKQKQNSSTNKLR